MPKQMLNVAYRVQTKTSKNSNKALEHYFYPQVLKDMKAVSLTLTLI